MNTLETVSNLRLMADTIEELEIDNIISCEAIYSGEMHVHVIDLKITGTPYTWRERFTPDLPWEKSFQYNNIRFYSLATEEEYKKEKQA